MAHKLSLTPGSPPSLRGAPRAEVAAGTVSVALVDSNGAAVADEEIEFHVAHGESELLDAGNRAAAVIITRTDAAGSAPLPRLRFAECEGIGAVVAQSAHARVELPVLSTYAATALTVVAPTLADRDKAAGDVVGVTVVATDTGLSAPVPGLPVEVEIVSGCAGLRGCLGHYDIDPDLLGLKGVRTVGTRRLLMKVDGNRYHPMAASKTYNGALGVIRGVNKMMRGGFELIGDVKYHGENGIDGVFFNEATGRFAAFEAKWTSRGLRALKADSRGIVQGSMRWVSTRLLRGGRLDLFREFVSGKMDIYATIAHGSADTMVYRLLPALGKMGRLDVSAYQAALPMPW